MKNARCFAPLAFSGLVALCAPGCAESGRDDSHTAPDALVPADAGLDSAVDASLDPEARAYAIRFRAMVGSAAASCASTYPGFGPAADQSIRFKDFRFYVHAVTLLRADGGVAPLAIADVAPFQRAGVALLDFEDASHACSNGTVQTRDVVVGSAKRDEYVGVRFVLGVPFEQNHQDRSTAEPPLSLSALFWSWQGGYKFLRVDAETLPAGDALPATFNVHVGSTGCDGSAALGGTTTCSAPNRPTIELAGFDPDASVIEVDFAALVGATDLGFNTPNTGIGCMSAPNDPECAEILPSLGIPFGIAEPAMDVFRVGDAIP